MFTHATIKTTPQTSPSTVSNTATTAVGGSGGNPQMKPRVLAVIPARLGSTRFSQKVIHPYQGKPLLVHLAEVLSKCRNIDRLAVASDSGEIREALVSHGLDVIMTASRHRTGSDRVAEVHRRIGGQIVVNIQADCFGLSARVLDRVIDQFASDKGLKYGTLARAIDQESELADPNVVKVVTNRDSQALWFSRCPIPYLQNASAGPRFKQHRYWYHIGVYLFTASSLEQYTNWPRSPLEKAESLEQLRILENGGIMQVYRTRTKTISIDTKADLRKLSRWQK